MITKFKIYESKKILNVGDLVTFTYRKDPTIYKIDEIPEKNTIYISTVEGDSIADVVTSRMIRKLTPEEEEEFYLKQQSNKYNL